MRRISKNLKAKKSLPMISSKKTLALTSLTAED
jgi:hypothetical protein